jgi:1,4-dihydroxy-2-naphthoate octaprenyltransferase
MNRSGAGKSWTMATTPDTVTRSDPSTSGRATAALILGIVALLFVWLPILAWVLGGIAIALAITARGEIRRLGRGGIGQANAGLVLAIVAIVVGLAIGVLSAIVSTS